jgi:hypothetical protein
MNMRKIMDAEIQKVLAVCPDTDHAEIRADLEFTLTSIDTINRIFDGSFLTGTRLDKKPVTVPKRKPREDDEPAPALKRKARKEDDMYVCYFDDAE